MGLESKKAWYGRAFVLLWVAGFIPFFVIPFLKTFQYSLGSLAVTANGLEIINAGFRNYTKLFLDDAVFLRELTTAFKNMVIELPLIMSFSIFIAMLLNQPFRGRTLARSILFLPVIVTSGIVIYILKTDVNAMYAMNGVQGQSFLKMTALTDILYSLGLNSTLTGLITTAMNSIFDLTWKCGVQILLFIGGLQAIPASFYEAASVEGATSWEKFWKITFPMLTPILLTGAVYTVVDSFTYYGNNIMLKSIQPAFDNFNYSYASAMSIIYSIMVLLVLGFIFVVLRNRITYTER
ncbi:MAG: carbohydrate ABC transporter permease [Saccharofermentanales bacterium]